MWVCIRYSQSKRSFTIEIHMNKRPKIELELSPSDKILEIIGWILVLGIWMLTLANYFKLPETIPIHFNGAGEADGFGNKATILAYSDASDPLLPILTDPPIPEGLTPQI